MDQIYWNAQRIQQNKCIRDMNQTIIKSEKEHEMACQRLEVIFDSTQEDKTFKEAELLTMLIENYELETEPEFANPDPIEVIKFKMEQNNLRNKDLAKILGSKSKASEILNKKRSLSLNTIRLINKYLGIPAELLINEYKLVKQDRKEIQQDLNSSHLASRYEGHSQP